MVSENISDGTSTNFEVDRSAPLDRCGSTRRQSDGIFNLKLTLINDPAKLERDWQQLQKQAADAPFQDFDWTIHLFNKISVSKERIPVFVCFHSDNVLEAIFPLMKKHSFGVTALCWLAQDVNAYNGPLALPSFLDSLTPSSVGELWNKIISLMGKVDFLFLDKQPEYLGTYPNPFFKFKAQPFSAKSHAIILTDNWDSIYQRKISPKNRRNLRRRLRRLNELGTVSFDIAKTPDEKQKVIDKVLVWKSLQLDQKGVPNPFCSSEFIEYFNFSESDVIRKPILQAYSLNLSGDTIAAAVGFRTSYQFIGYLLAMKKSVEQKHSPGTLLQKFIIEDSISCGCKLFDLSAGDDRYKLDWADESSGISQSLKSFSLTGWLFVVLITCTTRFKRLIKSHRLLVSIVQFLYFHRTKLKKGLGI